MRKPYRSELTDAQWEAMTASTAAGPSYATNTHFVALGPRQHPQTVGFS